MKVGGMQFFRSEAFDTLGKVLPRAFDISAALLRIYLGLTVGCMLAFLACGLTGFDAVMHALTTVSTGGFSSYDASFGALGPAAEIVAIGFMLAAALPFIRYLQLAQGHVQPLWTDPQVRAFLRWLAYAIAAILAMRLVLGDSMSLAALREVAFNVVSVMTGTGFASVDVTRWGEAALIVLLVAGLAGGCTSSTVCSIKVFRWLILFGTIRSAILRLRSPNRIEPVRLGGRMVEAEVIDSVMAFFSLFILSFGVLIVALSMTGLSLQTSVTAAWTAIANVGPAWGAEVGATGAMDGFPTAAKWVMVAGMFVGRLEILSVFVILMPRFWRG
jgi:trk system potassium uptake protein TrkH